MSSSTFKKQDAVSCLVIDKTWDDILDKPDFFDELVTRVVDMMNAAEDFGVLTKETTLKQLKEAVNKILLQPLRKDYEGGETVVVKKDGTILADAFWDEIPQSAEKWVKFKEAVTRAYDMKQRIADHSPITTEDTFGETKDNFNDTIVKPMLDINEDE